MLQEMAAQSDAQTWAIVSMFFFLLAFAAAAAYAWRGAPAWAEQCARLPLTGDGAGPDGEGDPAGPHGPQTV